MFKSPIQKKVLVRISTSPNTKIKSKNTLQQNRDADSQEKEKVDITVQQKQGADRYHNSNTKAA